MQEIFASFSSRRRRLVQAAQEAGFAWVAKAPTKGVLTSGFLVDGGLLILSKRPFIRDPVYTTFSTCGKFADKVAAKGFFYAKLAVTPTQCVHLCTTHLQAYNSEHDGTHSIRMHQIDEITQYLSMYARDDPRERDQFTLDIAALPVNDASERVWPLVLTGDFNVNGRCSPTDGSHSAAYLELVDKLSSLGPFFDLLYDEHGEHPVTYADSVDRILGYQPKDQVLTCPSDYNTDYLRRQSIDYVFYFPGEQDAIVPTTTCVEKCEIDRTIKPSDTWKDACRDVGCEVSQLSDHYALDVTFTLI